MKKINKILQITILSICIVGCKKFLNINPSTTSVNPTKITDFQEMLNNDSLATGYYFLLDLMTDDTNMSDVQLNSGDNVYRRTYLWNSAIWNAGDTDLMYSSTYSRILQMNIILDRIKDATIDSLNTEVDKSIVISQALINRAWYYLQLANIYGPVFNTSTASTDLSVPLVLEPNSASLPSRATTEQTYNQILSDLHNALNNFNLPLKGSNIIHPGKGAGYALLARTYLYMSNYDSAAIYADSCLAINNSILNYSTSYVQPTQLLDLVNNPEIILGKISMDNSFYSIYIGTINISTDLFNLLGSQDIRYSKRFTSQAYNTTSISGISTIVCDNSIGVPEVMLIKAECAARSGDVDQAADIIETIRKNRYSTTPPTRTYTTDNILSYVLSERRKELSFHGGMRLFDLKRLNNDPTLKKDLTRVDGTGAVIASLPALSDLYNFPFAPIIIANNQNIIQNPR